MPSTASPTPEDPPAKKRSMPRPPLGKTIGIALVHLLFAAGLVVLLIWAGTEYREDYLEYNYARAFTWLVASVVGVIAGYSVAHAGARWWASRQPAGQSTPLENFPSRGYAAFAFLSLAGLLLIGGSLVGVFAFWSDVVSQIGAEFTGTATVLAIGVLGLASYLGVLNWREWRHGGRAAPKKAAGRRGLRARLKGSSAYFQTHATQALALFVIVLVAVLPLLPLLLAEPRCNSHCVGFSPAAYDLPTGPHYNAALDDPAVNQTVLAALEKGLHALTRVQQRGGFPMYVTRDGCTYSSDRGFGCPLFPGEFSLQGGTAKLGRVFVEMYRVEPDPVYLGVAEATAEALLAVQDAENGGFYYDGRRYPDGRGYQPHPHNERRAAILDDNVMQSCMSFLLDVYNVTGKATVYLPAIHAGFDCLDAMEKPHGGWRQRSNYPADSYQSKVTLNDDALQDVLFLMLKAHAMFPNETRYLAAAQRAGEFLVRVQGNGGAANQTGWAQQYGDDLNPCWARSFEPPAICSHQTVSAMECLLELYLVTGNASWLAPIPAGIAWLNASRITWTGGDGSQETGWSRLYELGTNRPIMGINDGIRQPLGSQYVYNFSEARGGYSWRGDYGAERFFEHYAKLLELGNDTAQFRAWRETPPTPSGALRSAWGAVEDQTEAGFWLHHDADKYADYGGSVIRDSACEGALSKLLAYVRVASAAV